MTRSLLLSVACTFVGVLLGCVIYAAWNPMNLTGLWGEVSARGLYLLGGVLLGVFIRHMEEPSR